MSGAVRATQAGQTLGSGIRPRAGGPAGQGFGRPVGAAEIIERLECAGATLLAMPGRGYSTGMRQMRFDIVHSALEAYGWDGAVLRAPFPTAAAITAMDEAFGWLTLIPEGSYVLRRIVGARALVHPLTQRHLYSWRRLAAALGTDHKAVKRWHDAGVKAIMTALAA
jgi:hypothetical protein